MRFSIDQNVAVPPAVALAAYGNPAFYEGRPPRDNVEVVEVVSHQDSGSRVLIEVRFKFTGAVSSAVRAVVDPKKMAWVTRTEVLPEQKLSKWTVLPDHYPDRLSGSGTYRFVDQGTDATTIKVEGEFKVHVPLVGRAVERVIVSGLRSYIGDEVKSIPDLH